jgi:hypothetical protein
LLRRIRSARVLSDQPSARTQQGIRGESFKQFGDFSKELKASTTPQSILLNIS